MTYLIRKDPGYVCLGPGGWGYTPYRSEAFVVGAEDDAKSLVAWLNNEGLIEHEGPLNTILYWSENKQQNFNASAGAPAPWNVG